MQFWQSRKATCETTLNTIETKQGYETKPEFDYETVKEVAGRIRSGELRITRLKPREEQGRIAGGRRNVEASIIIGAEASANQAASGGRRPTRKEKLAYNKSVELKLEKYARGEGIWFDYDEFARNHRYLAKGEESHVYEDKDIKFILKVMNYDFDDYGISLQDYIDNRISLHNYLFPESKYEVVGFTRNNEGGFRFILRQPFIIGKAVHPSTRKAFMKRVLGANSELDPEQYANPDYHIWDLHLGNLLQNEKGDVFVIDSLLELNTPGRGLDGEREYEEFSIGNTGESSEDNESILAQAVPSEDNFKKWFGNSKAVNENGQPQVFYHATGKESSQPAPILKIFGVNIVNPDFHKEIPSKALIMLREMTDNFKSEKDPLPESQRKAQTKGSLYRAMREAGDDKEKQKIVGDAIRRAEEKGILEAGELEFIERQKGLSELENMAKRAKLEQVERVLKVATDSEKDLLAPIVEAKRENKAKEAEKAELDKFTNKVRSGEVSFDAADKELSKQLEAGKITEKQYVDRLETMAISEAEEEAKNLDASSNADFVKIEKFVKGVEPKDREGVYNRLLKKTESKLKGKDVKSLNEAERLMKIIEDNFADFEKRQSNQQKQFGR